MLTCSKPESAFPCYKPCLPFIYCLYLLSTTSTHSCYLQIKLKAAQKMKIGMHYRTRLICRVQKALPSAFCRALGKGNLCREPDPAALDKDRPLANLPLPRAGHSANFSRRQKFSFAECRALGKDWPSAKKNLPSAGHSAKFGRRQRWPA